MEAVELNLFNRRRCTEFVILLKRTGFKAVGKVLLY